MKKEAFLKALRERLSDFPLEDIDERLLFYEEIIDERMEDGMSEEDAVAAVGTVEELAEQVMSEIPLSKLVVKKVKPKKEVQAWKIVLLALTFPVWFPFLISAVTILFSVYIVIWSVVICVYAVNLSLAASMVLTIPCAIQCISVGNKAGALFIGGVGILLLSFSILVFVGGNGITKGIVKLTKSFLLWIKSLFLNGKEDRAYA